MKINGSLVFDASSASEIQNLRVQKVVTNPTAEVADVGRLIYNTTNKTIYIGRDEGSSVYSWQALATGGDATALQNEVDALELALGDFFNSDGTFNGTLANALTNVDGATSLSEVLEQLDAAVSGKDALAELVDVDVAGVANTNLLQYNSTTSKWEDKAIGAASGVQAHDAGLDALATGGTGLVAMDGDSAFFRTLTMPAEGLSVTNGNGVAGNPTLALANDLAALEGLSGTGIAVRTGTDTWAQRTVVAGVGGTIVVTDGNGVAGNITLEQQSLTIPTNAGTFNKFNYDTYGRVTAVEAVAQADITGLVDAVYVNVSGDTMTGNLNMGGTATVTGLAAPTNASDAVTKNYVDNAVAGMTWEAPVLGIYATQTALDTAVPAPATGARYALEDAPARIVQWSGSAWVAENLVDGAAFFNSSTDTGYVYNGTAIVPFTGGGALVAGNGLLLTGNQIDVNFGAGITMLPSDEVGVHVYNYTGSAIAFATSGGARVATEAAAVSGDLLSLFLDGASLTQSGTGLKIADAGVTEAHLNTSVAGAGLVGGGGTALAVNVDDVTLEVASDVVAVKDSGITTAKIADGAVTNAKLANDNIQFVTDLGSTAISALGTNLNLVGGIGMITTGDGASTVTFDFDGTDVSVGDLNDVTLNTPTDGEVLVYSGTAFENRKVYHLHEQGSAATTWNVTHGLNQKYCNVTVVDDTDEVVIPQSVSFTNDTSLVVTFNTAVAGKVVVMGVQTIAPV